MNQETDANASPATTESTETSEETPVLYDSFYYQNCCGQPYERSEAVLAQFDAIADKIARYIQPKTVLDAGCAFGFLVERLRDRGIEAYGFDVSDYAISQVREDVRPYCWVGSIFDPLPQKYDLIINMEVIEHLQRHEAEAAVENLCRHSDDILFSSTPLDFREGTHFNVRPIDYWASLFAERGFYRDLEIDVSFVMPWAMRLRRIERLQQPPHQLIAGYERRLWSLTQEVDTLRGMAGEQRDLKAELERVLEHRAVVETDQQRLYTENAQLRTEIERLKDVEQQLKDIQASRSWKLAQSIAKVAGRK